MPTLRIDNLVAETRANEINVHNYGFPLAIFILLLFQDGESNDLNVLFWTYKYSILIKRLDLTPTNIY